MKKRQMKSVSDRIRMKRLLVVCVLLVGCVCADALAEGPIAIPADHIADSVGVNVRLHNIDTGYGNFELVKWLLAQLGVRHLRDGLIDTTWQGYYDRHNALGAMGIRGIFIAPPALSDAALRAYPTKMAHAFEGYELPNELDATGLSTWTATLLRSLAQFQILDVDPHVTHFPVIGPSLTTPESYAALGDVSGYYDHATLHNYMAGRNPGNPGWGDGGYGSIAWNLALATRYAPGRAVITTETGYWDDPALAGSIPPVIAGRYIPRLVLEQFQHGIARTYIYELIDFPVPGLTHLSGYGLVRADGQWKPAFHALRNLMRVFADPGPEPPPASFAYDITGNSDASMRRMVFQKRDGTFLLALWLEQPGYNVDAQTPIPVAKKWVQIDVPPSTPFIRSYQWLDGGGLSENTSFAGHTRIWVPVSDSLLVIRFGPPGTI
jgi:hypothetical protein